MSKGVVVYSTRSGSLGNRPGLVASGLAARCGRTLLAILFVVGVTGCHVSGTPFEPEMCQTEITVKIDPNKLRVLEIQADTIELMKCFVPSGWTTQRSRGSGG